MDSASECRVGCSRAWVVATAFWAVYVFTSVAAQNGPGSPGSFDDFYEVTWGQDHVTMGDGGASISLSLDQANASAFASKSKYLFGYFSTGIKLVPGNSAGTVTAYYFSSETGDIRDELDFEFLGNSTGEPYILQTNIFANGVGRREQRIFLWFDPTAEMHKYSVLWNRNQIVFYVDDYPIRFFENRESEGIAFPTSQPMGIYASLWNGDSWATQGGLVKLNWTHAPFVSTFGEFEIQGCDAVNNVNCASADGWWAGAQYQNMNAADTSKLKWVQQHYMVYDYCYDQSRYTTPPLDCTRKGVN
ncbi:hypothetical protein R1flu_011225 [Riccia fluitans]|uniref:Xyloglucan endotransglucosylase/hydrolase n=1 Tax=Riccia fluitans TaxID=41844 RepID=A0ABD1Z875_9MARC